VNIVRLDCPNGKCNEPSKHLRVHIEWIPLDEKIVENEEENRIENRHEHVAKEFSGHLLAGIFDNLESVFGPQGPLLGILKH